MRAKEPTGQQDNPRRGLRSRFPGKCILAAVAMWLAASAAAPAVEQAEEFVAGLHERGLDELTLDYLVRMQSSPLAGREFKSRIPYHRGVTLIEISRQTVDSDARSQLLEEARAELQKFAAANPGSASGAEANAQLASVLVEQAKQGIAQAEQLPDGILYDRERENHNQQARRLLDEARGLFQQADATYSAELKKLSDKRGAADDDTEPDQRQEYRGRLAQVRVLAAQTQYDKAQTYPQNSATFRRLNQDAAKELAVLYDSYSRWLVGLYAHLYEGRCYQALGDYQRALGCYEQLISQPSVHPAFRKLIAAAFRYRAECFLDREEYDAAIASCASWLDKATQVESNQPEWLVVRFRLAEALQHKGEAQREGSPERRRLTAGAAEAYRMVAGAPNEFQAAARTAAAELAPRERKRVDEPRDFVAAYEAGKAAIASANAARIALPSAERNNPTAAAELQQQIRNGTDDARHYFRLATTLVEDGTDESQLNEVRYFLCWLYWDDGDYYRAAVLGEFLARRYPDHPAAGAAAKMAMASYDRLYQEAIAAGSEKGDTDFEAKRMADVAEFITRRWPDTPDADAAFSVLVTYAIRNDRIDQAEEMLAEASPRNRAQLEIQLGNAMWGHYLELAHLDDASRPNQAALDRLKQNAVKHLASGFESARQARTASEATATAALYLTQSFLADGKYQQAIDLLEDDHVGPLTLVSRDDPATARTGYVIEVYKAALRAYVSATPPQARKALDTMRALEESVDAGSGAETGELTRIYLGLGVALQQQMEQLRDAGRDKEADQIAEAFSLFLDQLSARQGDDHWAGRQWIAQTYYGMGEKLAGKGSTQLARQYFTKARDAYRQLLASAEAGSSPPPHEEAALLAQKQLGDCLRQLGEYQPALEMYSAVLKEKESWLAVQYAAAMTYQQRGEAGAAKWLERAIYGGYRLKSTGKNRIWGWLKLAQVADRAARSNAKYRDTFFEARLNAARCRYLVGLKSEGAAREQHFATAMQNIRSMEQLYPDMGGERWKQEFDQLRSQIQKSANLTAKQ